MLLINIYKAQYKYFKSGVIYVQNERVCELLKYILNTKTTNDRTQVNTNQTIGEHLVHLKDLELSKYNQELKGGTCMPIKFIVLFLLIVVLIGFLKIKSVKI
jgi:hypothetical protein